MTILYIVEYKKDFNLRGFTFPLIFSGISFFRVYLVEYHYTLLGSLFEQFAFFIFYFWSWVFVLNTHDLLLAQAGRRDGRIYVHAVFIFLCITLPANFTIVVLTEHFITDCSDHVTESVWIFFFPRCLTNQAWELHPIFLNTILSSNPNHIFNYLWKDLFLV